MPNPTTHLEQQIYNMIAKCEELTQLIRDTAPIETLFTSTGEPNIRTRYGAILSHITTLRATLRGFYQQP